MSKKESVNAASLHPIVTGLPPNVPSLLRALNAEFYGGPMADADAFRWLPIIADAIERDAKEAWPVIDVLAKLTEAAELSPSALRCSTSTFALEIEEIDCTKMIGCGFKHIWIDAESDGMEISLGSGAGCGSPWLTLTIKQDDGTTRYFRSDMREFLKGFVGQVVG